jgi:hypothetical protein
VALRFLKFAVTGLQKSAYVLRLGALEGTCAAGIKSRHTQPQCVLKDLLQLPSICNAGKGRLSQVLEYGALTLSLLLVKAMQQTKKLNDGRNIPVLGLGVYRCANGLETEFAYIHFCLASVFVVITNTS